MSQIFIGKIYIKPAFVLVDIKSVQFFSYVKSLVFIRLLFFDDEKGALLEKVINRAGRGQFPLIFVHYYSYIGHGSIRIVRG